MAMRENFAAFFNTAEFADNAALTPAAGGLAKAGVVIYDEGGVINDFDVVTVGPVCVFPTEQWPDAEEPDTLEIAFRKPIGSRVYRVRSKTLLTDGAISMLTLVRI